MAGKRKWGAIVLCSSASFYDQLLDFASLLEKQGFKVVVPLAAREMKTRRDFRVSHYKTWFKNPRDFKIKSALVAKHFQEIKRGDKIIVLNFEKKGIKGYIGGNVLMEMAIAFFLKRQIYVLNNVPKKSNIYEEIMATRPIFLGGKLENFFNKS